MPDPVVQLPPRFRSTHPTSGLDGYPAVDIFAPTGSRVLAGFWGKVRRISGKPRTGKEAAGGAYGFNVYVLNGANGIERFIGHLGSVRVKEGDRVKPGTLIGTVAEPPTAEKRPGTAHVHLGMRS